MNGSYKLSFFSDITRNDSIKKAGQISKKCLTNNETYISTLDPWKTFYYFGRPMLPGVEGELWTPKKAIEMYNQGDFRNEVYLIHYTVGELDNNLEIELRKKASKEYRVKNHRVFVFKDCNY